MAGDQAAPEFSSNSMFFYLKKKVSAYEPLAGEIRTFLEEQCASFDLAVCHINFNGTPEEPGFLIFEYFITTTAPLQKAVVNRIEGRLVCRYLAVRGERCVAGLYRPTAGTQVSN